MRLKAAIVMAGVLAGCGPGGGLREELSRESKDRGLALVSALNDEVTVIRFGGPVLRLRAPDPSPLLVVGKAGEMVGWKKRMGDEYSEIEVDGVGGNAVSAAIPPLFRFRPMALSEAGKRIAGTGSPEFGGDRQLWWVSFDWKQRVVIGGAMGLGSVDWSPDGNSLVFARDGRIFVYEARDGSRRELAKGQDPTWSPDGRWIAFRGWDDRAALMTLSGEPARWLLQGRRVRGPVRWSPDGRYVSFVEVLPWYHVVRLRRARLSVMRIADGAEMAVEDFGTFAAGEESFEWLTGYQKFCLRCGRL